MDTPWWCLAVDASISYYLWPVPDDRGRVKLVVDGWDTHTALISICQDGVNEELKRQVPDTLSYVSDLVDYVFAHWNGERTITTAHGTLSIDRELPGVLPRLPPPPPPPSVNCPGSKKPTPPCPRHRPKGKPISCILKKLDENDPCSELICECETPDY